MSKNYSEKELWEMPRPQSQYPSMPLSERTKIFSSFMPLRQYNAAAREKEQVLLPFHEKSSDELATFNNALRNLKKGDAVKIEYFQTKHISEDGIPLGAYESCYASVTRIDFTAGLITFSGTTVPIGHISQLQILTEELDPDTSEI